MAKHEHSVELTEVNLAGRDHVGAFFNTIDEEHRVLSSFYKDGIDRGEKAGLEALRRDEGVRPVPGQALEPALFTISSPANVWRKR
jgi:hypothetical protein